MRYLYMDNFRGFSHALIPLRAVTFLVGENSSGKSSFLSLINALSRFPWELAFDGGRDLGFSNTEQSAPGFLDLVSVSSKNRTCFTIGLVEILRMQGGQQYSLRYNLFCYVNRSGSPSCSQYHVQTRDAEVSVFIGKPRTQYKFSVTSKNFKSRQEAEEHFLRAASPERSADNTCRALPTQISGPAPPFAVLQFITSSEVKRQGPGLGSERPARLTGLVGLGPITSLAPIRTRSQRFYGGLVSQYSPEGAHIPYFLRHSVKSRSRSSRALIDKIQNFGRNSGLYETITASTFGKGHNAPFELRVEIPGGSLNINNVGYGVSQALPLIVEFLRDDTRKTFIVQQPEVHLHPRAQASLGDLIFEVALEKKHSFYIETHSDYLIDRFRLALKDRKDSVVSQVLFFSRASSGNSIHVLKLEENGSYPLDQPNEFRDFFVREELRLLDIP